MLDQAFGLTASSRLGCQVVVTPDMEGITVQLPAATRNFYVDGHFVARCLLHSFVTTRCEHLKQLFAYTQSLGPATKQQHQQQQTMIAVSH
eukprot:8565-Heterococcus_DN1.PRE.4